MVVAVPNLFAKKTEGRRRKEEEMDASSASGQASTLLLALPLSAAVKAVRHEAPPLALHVATGIE